MRYFILIFILLTGCSSRRKHQRHEYTALQHTATEQVARIVREAARTESIELERKDSTGTTRTTLYGVQGRITADGTFTGSADSSRTESSSQKKQEHSRRSEQTRDSIATDIKDSIVQGTIIQDAGASDIHRSGGIPWWLYVAGILTALYFILFKTPLKRFFQPFKL